MKLNELRKGNFIKFSENGTEFIVDYFDEIGVGVHNDKETTWIEADLFEPIELTEEWLLGFYFETDKIIYWNGNISLGFFKDGFFYTPTSEILLKRGIELKYVHQLQNLYFALTGKEL